MEENISENMSGEIGNTIKVNLVYNDLEKALTFYLCSCTLSLQ